MKGARRRPFAIAVHSGVGRYSGRSAGSYKSALTRACEAGMSVLSSSEGATALEAAEAAVASLEADPLTNAATGSNLTGEGTVECDASVSYCSRGSPCVECGAVAAVPGVVSPISVAAALLREQRLGPVPPGLVRPMCLAGSGAREWARSRGLDVCDGADLVTPESRKTWERLRSVAGGGVGGNEEREEECHSDTVGAVAFDCDGGVSAAVSSGGAALRHSGRVGEAGVCGCGCWTTPYGVACCASGVGEQVSRALLSLRCAESLSDPDAESCTALQSVFQDHLFSQPSFCSLSPLSHMTAGVLCLKPLSETSLELVIAHTFPSSFAVCWATSSLSPFSTVSNFLDSPDDPLHSAQQPPRLTTMVHRLRL